MDIFINGVIPITWVVVIVPELQVYMDASLLASHSCGQLLHEVDDGLVIIEAACSNRAGIDRDLLCRWVCRCAAAELAMKPA